MSEQQHSHEHHKAHEKIDTGELQRQRLEQLQKAANRETKNTPEKVHELSKSAADEAISAKEFTIGEKAENQSSHNQASPKELKAVAYTQTLQRIRTRLPAAQRALSRVIHQPTIDTVSNVSAKTVARPSGLLGGGLFALLGSIILLYLSKHYGFTYNYLSFVLLFGVGFLVGAIFELLLYPFRHHHRL